MRGKLLMKCNRQDLKGALINFNNALLIKERELKVFVRKAECFCGLGNNKKALEELESIGSAIAEGHCSLLDSQLVKYLQILSGMSKQQEVVKAVVELLSLIAGKRGPSISMWIQGTINELNTYL